MSKSAICAPFPPLSRGLPVFFCDRFWSFCPRVAPKKVDPPKKSKSTKSVDLKNTHATPELSIKNLLLGINAIPKPPISNKVYLHIKKFNSKGIFGISSSSQMHRDRSQRMNNESGEKHASLSAASIFAAQQTNTYEISCGASSRKVPQLHIHQFKRSLSFKHWHLTDSPLKGSQSACL